MAFFEQTNLTNDAGVIINPATEDSAADTSSLLRRMLNVLLAPLGYDNLCKDTDKPQSSKAELSQRLLLLPT